MYQNNQRSYAKLLNRKLLSFVFTLFFIASMVSTVHAQTMQTALVSKYTRIEANVGGYLESLPNDYAANPTKKYPLLIAMHGVGERGNGSPGVLEKVANIAIPKRIKNGAFPASFTVGGKTYSFIVICPQMENANDWTASIQAVIDYAKANYRVDEQKIYLTGLSLGGISEWVYIARSSKNGENLAAALLVCPGATYNADQLRNVSTAQLPVWVTNNSGDPYNPASGAISLVNALNASLPAHPAALITIFDKTGHDAWTQTYDPAFKQDGLNVYEWMLSKTRGSQSTPVTPLLTANAGPDQILTLPTNSITLDASGSAVTSGSITSYSWTKVSGPTAGLLSLLSSGLQANLTDLVEGTYVYQLTVKDSNGSTATDNVTITVNTSVTSTDPPTANAGKGQTITLPVNSATLDGSLSKASTGNTIVSYKWTKTASSPAGGDITNATSVKTTVTNLIAGTYTYSLTVTDSRGSSKTGGTVVVVNPDTAASTDPPTAKVAQSLISLTLPTNSVILDGSSSVAAAGNTIVSYKWSKYTGPAYDGLKTPTNAVITVTGMIAGSYGFTLIVTDNNGKTSSKNVAVLVTAATSTRTASAETAPVEDVSLNNDRVFNVKAFEATVSPNPVLSSVMNIKVNGTAAGKTSILVYNAAGQLQLQQAFTKEAGAVSKQVNIAKLPAGIYVVQIIIDAKHKQILRIVKQ